MGKLTSFVILAAFSFTLSARAQNASPVDELERAHLHATPEWSLIEPHLPDLKTATPAQLESTADVLRARRFTYDAADFYRAAIERGGDPARLFNRLGMVQLELRHPDLARAYFLRAIALQPKNAQFWNNAGAAEFVAGDSRTALHHYARAVKLDKKNAIFHANLATAYFENSDFESARKQFETAFHLDPALYQHQDGSGVQARVFSSTNHGRFCFELARVSASGHDDAAVLSWLAKSSESGYDIQAGIANDRLLEPYRNDPRVKAIVQNARAMRNGRTVATSSPIPTLPSKLTPNTE